MLEFLKELVEDAAKTVGTIVGTITGPIIGLSKDVIATALGITIVMVEEALKAGCKTYEEIKDFHKL